MLHNAAEVNKLDLIFLLVNFVEEFGKLRNTR